MPPTPDDPDATEIKASPLTKLLLMIEDRYEVNTSTDGQIFAVTLPGLSATRGVLMGGSLKAALARDYYQTYGSGVSSSTVSDALWTAAGIIAHKEPVELPLRNARYGDKLVVDLGDKTFRAVTIGPGGWSVGESPVLFRRTATTAPLPEPVRGGDLSTLRAQFNVSDSDFSLLVGRTVTALFPDYACPLIALSGPPGSSKTTAAEKVQAITDPSRAPVRKPPRDAEKVTNALQGSRAVTFDNITHISNEVSDAFCRAVTGDSNADRKLYTDGDLHVTRYKSAITITGVDLVFRGDLADRAVYIELEPIDGTTRRSEAEMAAAFQDAYPAALGALYDIVAKVLAALPMVDRTGLPRMADFGLALRAMDAATGSDSFAAFAERAKQTTADMAEGDPFVVAIQNMLRAEGGSWTGSAGGLALRLPVPHGDRRLEAVWPQDGRTMGAWLKRTAPYLTAVGVEMERSRSNGTKMVHLRSDSLRKQAPSKDRF